MQGLHRRPIEVGKGVSTATRFGWTLLLLCAFGSSYVHGSDTDLEDDSAGGALVETTAANCAVPVVNGGDPVRLNEPSLMAQYNWLELSSPPTIEQLIHEAPFNTAVNWQMPVTTMPLTAANMKDMYRRGFKLYQFHNRNTPNHVEVHQYQHNRYRGILTLDNLARAMTNNLTIRGYRDDKARKANEVTEHVLPGKNTMKGFQQAMFPHKKPRVPGDGLPKNHPGEMDTSRPAFEIHFNRDIALLLKKCGEAERRDIDAVTKERRVDDQGHTLMSTSTWFTPEVQAVVAEMVANGDGYTIGVYTTKDHPWVIESGEEPGKLVGGIASIHVDGVSTGLTLFMDRMRGPQKASGAQGDYVYGNAGKIAFMAEVMHTFDSGAKFLDTVTVNEAARITGSVLMEREVYMQHVQAAHLDPKPLHIPTGPYILPFERYEAARFYDHLGLEAPRQNVSKKESNKSIRARGGIPGQSGPPQLPNE